MRSPHESYPPDEFDAVAPSGPRGAHRAPRSGLSRWWPFVAVLVVVPVLAFGLITWLSDWDGLPGALDPGAGQDEDPTAGEEPTAEEPTAGETEGATEEPEPEVTEEAPPPEPDLTLPVEVFNATNRSGLAGRAGDTLEGAGFTSVTTGNWDQEDPAASVVRYAPAETGVTAATAQSVADALGIATVEESADVTGIVVVLMDDFAG